jgi:hypothetical protein
MANVIVQSEAPDTNGPTRLDLTSATQDHAVLDGAWWPRTRDSASELAGLVTALDAKEAVVSLIMLNPYGWLGRPRRVHVADRTVRIAWIADLDRMVVIGTATRNRRIDLLLIVPTVGDETGPHAATAQPLDANASISGSIAAMTRALTEVGNETPGAWVAGVRAAFLVLFADFRNQNDVTSRTTGAYRQVVAATPRLSYAMARLNRERADVGVLFDRTLANMAQPATATQVDRIRAQISTLLQQLTQYQQHGADLLHETDQVDIGGQG